MTSHCAGTVHVQMREESERGTRKWEEMWFKTTAEDGERERGGIKQAYKRENTKNKTAPFNLFGACLEEKYEKYGKCVQLMLNVTFIQVTVVEPRPVSCHGGLSGEEAGGCCPKVGGANPLEELTPTTLGARSSIRLTLRSRKPFITLRMLRARLP